LIEAITAGVWERIRNPAFKSSARDYLDIAADFRDQIRSCGLPISQECSRTVGDECVRALKSHGVVAANDGKSLSLGWLSPSCVTCRKGIGAATFSISTQCTRNCFFCFNPNQKDYIETRHHATDPAARLQLFYDQGFHYDDLALTGGEPLLHKEEALVFFRHAGELYPDAYTRLYTSGSFLDREYLRALCKVGLDEIRISIKTDDSEEERAHTLKRLEMSRAYIPHVVVEMPVMPDEFELMQRLLLTLDGIGINGINLLELCFPYHNAAAFARRGFEIKREQFRVLYNYQYAGGLPIAGSEDICLRLLEFALQKGLKMGIHYCSLENKFSGQVYLQNISFASSYGFCAMSERDFFLKSAKVFGRDIEPVRRILQRAGMRQFYHDTTEDLLAFVPESIPLLRRSLPNLEVGLSYQIVEPSDDGNILRELRIDYTTPRTFNPAQDI
jgi:pyruvate formate-lyase activating enzyme-like uncharacterized protein